MSTMIDLTATGAFAPVLRGLGASIQHCLT
nr:MAG TPA: hypothetical protein [Microviridae sp.]